MIRRLFVYIQQYSSEVLFLFLFGGTAWQNQYDDSMINCTGLHRIL